MRWASPVTRLICRRAAERSPRQQQMIQPLAVHLWRQDVAVALGDVEFLGRFEAVVDPGGADELTAFVARALGDHRFAQPHLADAGLTGLRLPNQAMTPAGAMVAGMACSARA